MQYSSANFFGLSGYARRLRAFTGAGCWVQGAGLLFWDLGFRFTLQSPCTARPKSLNRESCVSSYVVRLGDSKRFLYGCLEV